MEQTIVPLAKASDTRLVGGKAAALCRLINAGFNVPPGFVITTLAHNHRLDFILDEFDKLGAQKVAVRSSAVAEDGAKDAWAGQLDTFLNVKRSELLDKVAACFKSANSDRAKAYARQKNTSSGRVAVIIQKMVPAQISGVAFSSHPVTGNSNHAVIESVRGLGEKLVSGIITPDTHVIDKTFFKVIEKNIQNHTQNLTDKQIKELMDAIIKIEKFFSHPVDIEWSRSAKELFILQSRPITTLG
jgi:phosphoenolpyruvate synthase/pyruvate phosphate dikinase